MRDAAAEARQQAAAEAKATPFLTDEQRAALDVALREKAQGGWAFGDLQVMLLTGCARHIASLMGGFAREFVGWAVGGSRVVIVSGLAGSMCLLGDRAAVAPAATPHGTHQQYYATIWGALGINVVTHDQGTVARGSTKNSTVTWNVVLASATAATPRYLAPGLL